MREIKFRAWHKGRMHYFDLSDTIAPNMEMKVMQYTGLKNKNGKEIYEGDILPTTDVGNVEVVWAEFKGRLKGFPDALDELEMWGWCVRHKKYGIQPLDDSFYLEKEVIGNIHENPELI